jgi:Spy/CpxP family protein refolding chaperone
MRALRPWGVASKFQQPSIESMEIFMRRVLPFVVAFVATSAPVFSQNVADAPGAPAKAAPSEADVQKAMQEFRGDLQAKRADIMAKNISLSADQAAKFWPLYQKYQAEQNAIIDAQLRSLKDYVDHFNNLDDAHATAYVESLLKRDEDMGALRRKWLAEFEKVVPITIAARVIQIDRRLSNVGQVALSSQIPLIR